MDISERGDWNPWLKEGLCSHPLVSSAMSLTWHSADFPCPGAKTSETTAWDPNIEDQGSFLFGRNLPHFSRASFSILLCYACGLSEQTISRVMHIVPPKGILSHSNAPLSLPDRASSYSFDPESASLAVVTEQAISREIALSIRVQASKITLLIHARWERHPFIDMLKYSLPSTILRFLISSCHAFEEEWGLNSWLFTSMLRPYG